MAITTVGQELCRSYQNISPIPGVLYSGIILCIWWPHFPSGYKGSSLTVFIAKSHISSLYCPNGQPVISYRNAFRICTWIVTSTLVVLLNMCS